ncbi:MAG: endonuclease III [Candidatus Aenigmatarchaeota archaeon]|nr:MAG: endonuclease III [Candidatus Aenigmarchaeota archaeon]
MNEWTLGDIILKRLRERFGKISSGEFVAKDIAESYKDPFKIIVGVIISQNTIESNTFKAYNELERRIGVEVEKLANADIKDIEESIKVAGLQDSKARAIKTLAERIKNELNGDLSNILKDYNKARNWLTSIPGIGVKTADVLLANMGASVLPVDTHIKRIAIRLGLAEKKSYEHIRKNLERIFRPSIRLEAHLLLIKLGREICKARNPQCKSCPLRDICKHPQVS